MKQKKKLYERKNTYIILKEELRRINWKDENENVREAKEKQMIQGITMIYYP